MKNVTRRIEFDSAHRVLRHESKCRFLHGHRYVAEVTVSAPELDPLGRVVDFGVMKTLIGGWVDTNWDHNILLNSQDPLLEFDRGFDGRPPYLFVDCNPTAENIAVELFRVAGNLLVAPLVVTHVRIYETPNCWADYDGT